MNATSRSAAARQWVAIGQAMATQVQRVNDHATPDAAAELRELRAENQRLLDALTDAQALITDLKAQLDDGAPSPSFLSPSPLGRGVRGEGSIPRRMVDALTGRPIGTQTAYARLHNVKPYTVSRYVAAGKLTTCGRYVYLDQPLPTKGY